MLKVTLSDYSVIYAKTMGEVFRDGCEPVFKFMKSIDWEFTNESNKDCIDKFVRYDYNVWNLIRRYIGVPLNAKIVGA